MRPKQESGSLARGACKAAQYKADASCSHMRTARTRRSNLPGSCLGVHSGAVVGASGETSLWGYLRARRSSGGETITRSGSATT